jgi:acetoin utilization protein AcuC
VSRVPLEVAYSDRYLLWQLGEGHPTNPVRAKLAVELLSEIEPSGEVYSYFSRWSSQGIVDMASTVHDGDYVKRVVLQGDSGEFPDGRDRLLGHTAAIMFAGTAMLMDRLENRGWTPGVSFNPQGAKHHAGYALGGGFCVLNDHAWAAAWAMRRGRRVAVLDWDVHHGNGTEELLYHTDAVTMSIHQSGIFPGTGLRSDPACGAYNYPLLRGWGDTALIRRVELCLQVLEERGGVDVLLLAAGADGLGVDPLGGLEYTMVGLYKAAGMVGEWCARRGVPIVVGGAGGYTPLRETPMAWAGVVSTLVAAYS